LNAEDQRRIDELRSASALLGLNGPVEFRAQTSAMATWIALWWRPSAAGPASLEALRQTHELQMLVASHGRLCPRGQTLASTFATPLVGKRLAEIAFPNLFSFYDDRGFDRLETDPIDISI